VIARLRAAWRVLRTGRTYEQGFTLGRRLGYDNGLHAGQDQGFDAAFADITANLDAAVQARLNPQPAATTVRHLTLVAGGAR
jgi:flagellar biosynthesis/type III secretory pathway protein FliH